MSIPRSPKTCRMPSPSEPDVRFVVPGLPRGKQRARSRIVTARSGHQFVSTYTPAQTRQEEAVVRFAASRAMNGREPIEGPVDLRISIFLPVPQSWSGKKQRAALSGDVRPTTKPDFDNCTKAVCDACNAIVWRDDTQVVAAHVWKYYSDRPRVVCEVRLIVPTAAAKPAANPCASDTHEN